MASTRFNYDPARTKRSLEESTFSGRYALDTPGPGMGLPFYEDTQIRLQKWGANLTTNTINLESDLMGISRPLNRDNIEQNIYQSRSAYTQSKSYPSAQPMVEESRASNPAWTYKDLEQSRWDYPLINPQANLEKQFHENIQTRILEKDYFKPTIPIVGMNSDGSRSLDYYLTGKSMCLGEGTDIDTARPNMNCGFATYE